MADRWRWKRELIAEEREWRTDPPSWGVLGSLLAQRDPALYAAVLRQHEQLVDQERARYAKKVG